MYDTKKSILPGSLAERSISSDSVFSTLFSLSRSSVCIRSVLPCFFFIVSSKAGKKLLHVGISTSCLCAVYILLCRDSSWNVVVSSAIWKRSIIQSGTNLRSSTPPGRGITVVFQRKYKRDKSCYRISPWSNYPLLCNAQILCIIGTELKISEVHSLSC